MCDLLEVELEPLTTDCTARAESRIFTVCGVPHSFALLRRGGRKMRPTVCSPGHKQTRNLGAPPFAVFDSSAPCQLQIAHYSDCHPEAAESSACGRLPPKDYAFRGCSHNTVSLCGLESVRREPNSISPRVSQVQRIWGTRTSFDLIFRGVPSRINFDICVGYRRFSFSPACIRIFVF